MADYKKKQQKSAYGNERQYGSDDECTITDPCSFAACAFLILGFLGTGVMLMVAGTELQKTAPNFETVEIEYAIAAGFILLAFIGHYMGVPDVICGTDTRGLAYFGHMFIFIGYVGLGGFMLGSAINMTLPGALPDPTAVESFSYLSGTFLIIFVLGWLIGNYEYLNCCERFLVASVGHYVVVILLLIAGGLYFGFGKLFRDGDIEESGSILLVIGVCFVISSIGLILVKCC